MAVALLSSDDNTIYCVLPVLWMTHAYVTALTAYGSVGHIQINIIANHKFPTYSLWQHWEGKVAIHDCFVS